MRFNYQKEITEFEKRQEELRRIYREAGMAEESIGAMYDYDREELRRERVFRMHNRSFDFDADYGDGMFAERTGGAYREYMDQLTCTDRYLTGSLHDLMQDIDDPDLVKALLTLTGCQRRILEMLVLDGMSQRDVAEALGVGASTVCRQVGRIRKKLKKFAE